MVLYNRSKGTEKSRGGSGKTSAYQSARSLPKRSEKIFKEILKNPLTNSKSYGTINTEKRERELLKTRKETKTMTMKELLNSLTEGTTVTAEMAEKAQAELTKMATEAANRAAKAKEKKASEDAPLVDAVTNLLSDHQIRTASQIREAVEGIDSTSKATAICKRIEGIKVSDVQVDKRIVKGYSL